MIIMIIILIIVIIMVIVSNHNHNCYITNCEVNNILGYLSLIRAAASSIKLSRKKIILSQSELLHTCSHSLVKFSAYLSTVCFPKIFVFPKLLASLFRRYNTRYPPTSLAFRIIVCFDIDCFLDATWVWFMVSPEYK
uniref:Uncharacterized protein n=1 Tax=Anopheles darlingi TaxID=43151 RepID=A0A2M4DA76_ANODA